MVRCLLEHTIENDLHNRNQSAYRPYHSTETALVLVKNNALDQRQGVKLILLDMSAFNIGNHDILITRLEKRIGVTDSAIAWICSYSYDRTQLVKIPGGASNSTKIVFGVPQGSALGPLLFTIYTAPIGSIIRLLHLNCHLYADDTQLYIKFKTTDENDRLIIAQKQSRSS